ncbi:MAG: DNA polymerase Y family protein [Pseudomonadota bacterium]
MPTRRILSVWFPRLAAERLLRAERGVIDAPFAVVGERRGVPVLVSLSKEAQAAGLRRDQPVRDARAMCPALISRVENPPAEADFLAALQRWAGKFSPWIAVEPPTALVADLTGCAHLFGGEEALLAQIEEDCGDLGLSVRLGIADTLGAAWALARYGVGGETAPARSGDAIDQEARATRSRAAKRRNWERGGTPPELAARPARAQRIAPTGKTRTALAPLPVGALRLSEEVSAQLARLGLRRVEDLANQPRAGLARRFGQELVLRLDQALGMVPEPVSPAAAPPRFAVRLTLPEPIGLEEDVSAGLDRLLPALCARLSDKGQGARRVRLHVERTDRTWKSVEIGLARPTADPERLRPLLRMKLGDLEAGDGIDVLRLEAHVTEPVHAVQHRGQLAVTSAASAKPGAAETAAPRGPDTDLEDLISRLGARIGLEEILRLHPGDSHIPEKSTQVRAAAWSAPAEDWQVPAAVPRPLVIFRPEPVHVAEGHAWDRRATRPRAHPPDKLRWRRRDLTVRSATGPERIAPEWWFDEPEWRSGVRDYWQVEVETGERLWVYYAHGAGLSPGWFCHGTFA